MYIPQTGSFTIALSGPGGVCEGPFFLGVWNVINSRLKIQIPNAMYKNSKMI